MFSLLKELIRSLVSTKKDEVKKASKPVTYYLEHPERSDDEVFIGNFIVGSYEEKKYWPQKRLGDTSYDDHGLPLPKEIRPGFVKKEVIRGNIICGGQFDYDKGLIEAVLGKRGSSP